METSKTLQEQVKTLEDYIGVYNTIKGSIVKEGAGEKQGSDFTSIEFFGGNIIKSYDNDSTYIDKLLGNYSANDKDIRNEIEKTLEKMKKPENVKNVYRAILNAMDRNEVEEEEDILVVKRRFFTDVRDQALHEFSNTWFVSLDELHSSAIQYVIGTEPIPNIGSVINSACFDDYKVLHPDAKKLKYSPEMKRQWKEVLDKIVVPLDDELR